VAKISLKVPLKLNKLLINIIKIINIL
jgi:hypothetical protein